MKSFKTIALLLLATVITLASCKKENTQRSQHSLHQPKDSVIYHLVTPLGDTIALLGDGRETKCLVNGVLLSDQIYQAGGPGLVQHDIRLTNYRPAVLDSTVIFMPLFTGDTVTVITQGQGPVIDQVILNNVILSQSNNQGLTIADTLTYIIQ